MDTTKALPDSKYHSNESREQAAENGQKGVKQWLGGCAHLVVLGFCFALGLWLAFTKRSVKLVNWFLNLCWDIRLAYKIHTNAGPTPGKALMSDRIFKAAKAAVHNRGVAPDSFLNELIDWGRTEPDETFAPNPHFDIYSKVREELGPWENLLHRKAGMLEVMRVLALFESSCNWKEGVDSSRRTGTTKENAEAGAWQVSWDARKLDPSLSDFLKKNGITDGVAFQQRTKTDHPFAMTFTALLLRIDMKDFNRIANGPVRKSEERRKTWPDLPRLWDARESIYPWLSRNSVAEFQGFLK